jgi:hypothetical protein
MEEEDSQQIAYNRQRRIQQSSGEYLESSTAAAGGPLPTACPIASITKSVLLISQISVVVVAFLVNFSFRTTRRSPLRCLFPPDSVENLQEDLQIASCC